MGWNAFVPFCPVSFVGSRINWRVFLKGYISWHQLNFAAVVLYRFLRCRNENCFARAGQYRVKLGPDALDTR